MKKSEISSGKTRGKNESERSGKVTEHREGNGERVRRVLKMRETKGNRLLLVSARAAEYITVKGIHLFDKYQKGIYIYVHTHRKGVATYSEQNARLR